MMRYVCHRVQSQREDCRAELSVQNEKRRNPLSVSSTPVCARG